MANLSDYNFVRKDNPYGDDCPLRYECQVGSYIVRVGVFNTIQLDNEGTLISELENNIFNLASPR